MSAIPGDIARVVAVKAYKVLDRLGVGPNRARASGGRWRMHPDTLAEMKRRMGGVTIGMVGLMVVNDKVDYPNEFEPTLLGMRIVEDATLAVTDLRLEVEA